MAKSPLTSLAQWVHLASLMGGNLSELGDVKKHVFRAGKEVLLAFKELLEIVEQYISEVNAGGSSQQALQTALGYAQGTIHALVSKLPKNEENDYLSMHRKVMGSILEVIESEISRSQKSKSHNAQKMTGKSHEKNQEKLQEKIKMKTEVLEAIRKVLLKEMYDNKKESL